MALLRPVLKGSILNSAERSTLVARRSTPNSALVAAPTRAAPQPWPGPVSSRCRPPTPLGSTTSLQLHRHFHALRDITHYVKIAQEPRPIPSGALTSW